MKKILIILTFLLVSNLFATELLKNFSKLEESEILKIEFKDKQLEIIKCKDNTEEILLTTECRYGDYQITSDKKRVLFFRTNISYKKELYVLDGIEGKLKKIWEGYGKPVANENVSYLLIDDSEKRSFSLYSVEEKKIVKSYKFETKYMKKIKDYFFSYSIFPSDNPKFDFFVIATEDNGYVCAEGYISVNSDNINNIYDNIKYKNSYKLEDRENELPKLW